MAVWRVLLDRVRSSNWRETRAGGGVTDGSSGEQWAERIEQLAAELATAVSLSDEQRHGATEALRDACDTLRAPQRPKGARLPRIGSDDPTAGITLGRVRRRHTAG